MAKRKRLSPPDPAQTPATGSHMAAGGMMGMRRAAAPIADMAGAASATAALEDLALEMQDARAQGRMIVQVPLDQVAEDYLVRDRTAMDPEELQALVTSLDARGQQVPIEVVSLGPDRYGLISGWRRLTALKQLRDTTGEERFARVACLLRAPEAAAGAYVAMVEENEIRADLSFYERAHIAARAAEQGAFDSPRDAVKALFAAVSPSKRSKIHSFGVVFAHLDDVLRFAREIPEHLGLRLAKALETEDGFAARLSAELRRTAPESAAEERQLLEAALSGTRAPAKAAAPVSPPVAPGVWLKAGKGRLTLSGEGVDTALQEDLRAWLATR